MVAQAIRSAVTEAKKRGPRKAKDMPTSTPEARALERDRHVRGTGYSHSPVNDFAQPLGGNNLYRQQGASGMGGWTATAKDQVKKLVEMVVREEIRAIRRG